MRIGNTIKIEDEKNKHRAGEWIEVFPHGCNEDYNLILRIPQEHRMASNCAPKQGQSPLLIRKVAWDKLQENNKKRDDIKKKCPKCGEMV